MSPIEATATTAAPIPTNVVAGTNVYCGKYYSTHGNFALCECEAYILIWLLDNDYCQAIAMAQGINLDDFLFLNPELNKNCSNLYLNYSYCMGSSYLFIKDSRLIYVNHQVYSQ